MQNAVHPSSLLLPALRALGYSVADKRGRADSRALARRAELATEAESAAGESLARIFDRFATLAPRACDCLFARLASRREAGENLLGAFPRPVWRAAHKACDRALRKMARETASEDVPALFDAGAPVALPAFSVGAWVHPMHAKTAREELRDGVAFDVPDAVRVSLACSKIRLRAESIRAALREVAADQGTRGATRQAVCALRWIDDCETRALALARGESSKPLHVLSSKGEDAREVVESLAIFDRTGRDVAHDGRGGVSGTRRRKDYAEHVANNAAHVRLRRVESFLGRSLTSF